MGDLLIDNRNFYQFEIHFLHYFGWLTKITFFLFFIGFFQKKPMLFLEFNFCIKVLLALFLIYRFNSYRKQKIEFTELDRKVCYSAGIYIFMISFIDYLDEYTEKIKKKVQIYTVPIIKKIKNYLHLFSYHK